MKVPSICVLAVAALVGGTAALTSSLATPAAAPAAPTGRIAVCDIVDVFNNYQRAKDLTAQLNERRQAIKAESDKRNKAIDVLRQELEAYKKGSPKYKQTFSQITWQTIEAKAYLQYQDALALREHRQLTQEMYQEITKMIARVAKQRGFDLVLHREPEDLTTESTTEMLRQIHSRKVLYAAETLDVTESVLASLNQAYKAAKADGGT